VLVLDEPTVGLDPVQTVEMRGLLRTLAGRTVLLSTHILSEASALCSRIVIMSRGRLLAEDTPEALAKRLAGVARITVRIDGPTPDITAMLESLPGVLRVERGAADEHPGQRFAIFAHEPVPAQRALAGKVVERGWTLLEVLTEAPSLEDLFVQLLAQTASSEAAHAN